jgi:hypothetical protein
MFTQNSRYQKLPEIVTIDSKGRVLRSKTLRPLPPVTDTVRHVITSMDHLDNLAYEYYQQPTRWWHICDANPEFMSPQALLGKEPIATARIPFTNNTLPWGPFFKQLSQKIGIEKVWLEDCSDNHQTGTLLITYNQINIPQPEDLVKNIENIIICETIKSNGECEIGPPEPLERVGQYLLIPLDSRE